MLLTRILIVVFVVLSAVYLPSHQIHAEPNNSTDPATTRLSLQSPNLTDAEESTQTFRDLVIGTHFEELKNVSHVKSRRKRSLFNLSSMVSCGTNCNRLYLTWYGNYCGLNWLGYPGSPIDKIDRCCYGHDTCYESVSYRYGKGWWSTYFRSYDWYCTGGGPICGTLQDRWRREFCRCDLRFVNCLQNKGCPVW